MMPSAAAISSRVRRFLVPPVPLVSAAAEDEAGESAGRKIYKHLMEGVSHMLPFVVSGGLFIALAFLIDGIAGVPQDGNFGTGTPISAWFKTIGGFAFSFMVPILAAYIAQCRAC